MEHIVFTQEELDRALGMGLREVALCDNTFTVPENIKYIKIGDVTVNIIDSQNKGENQTAAADDSVRNNAACIRTSFGSGYSSLRGSVNSSGLFSGYSMSYNSSLRLRMGSGFWTSYASSFRYRFASSFHSQFVSSFRTSFSTSFASVFRTSFASGIRTDYLSSSFGSFAGRNSSGRVYRLRRRVKEISVNGYGINLI